jgi:two-component system response regulator NreC
LGVLEKTRIVICDDHTLFVEGIKALFRLVPSLEVIGAARDGRQGIELVKTLKPDVLLMDVSMPGMSGVDAMRCVRQSDQSVKILMLTMHDEEEQVARCLEAGASGYIIKDVPTSQLLYAIEAVKKGENYLSAAVLKRVVDGYLTGGQAPRTTYHRLSGREREILQLLAEGISVKEAAVRLNLSVKTIEVHKYNLMRKIEVHNRGELIKYAIQKKLIAVAWSDS